VTPRGRRGALLAAWFCSRILRDQSPNPKGVRLEIKTEKSRSKERLLFCVNVFEKIRTHFKESC